MTLEIKKLTEYLQTNGQSTQKLEREHEDLMIENEEMRQTSLDSIEIAKV